MQRWRGIPPRADRPGCGTNEWVAPSQGDLRRPPPGSLCSLTFGTRFAVRAHRSRLSTREHEPRSPPRCASSWGRPDGDHVVARARQRPGDCRVGVPHLARAELVSPPRQHRYLWKNVEHGSDSRRIFSGPQRAVHSFGDVRDATAGPAPHLIAKCAESAKPLRPDRPFGQDTTISVGDVPHRTHLHGVCDVVEREQQPAVVQVRCCTMLASR